MTTTCKLCDREFNYTPLPGFPGIIPRVCSQCGESDLVKAAKARGEAAVLEKEATWSALCPAAYRTVSEGGITEIPKIPKVEWPEVERERPGLLMAGPSGRGKTRWAWRALRQDFDLGKTILAFTPRGFEASYRDADGQHKLKAFLDECSTVGVFFLDDLGKASWSPNTLETFYEIVERRSSNLFPIYATTNFTGNALGAQLRMDEAILEPLLRRLRENCRCVSV
jgi:hypothetical protein